MGRETWASDSGVSDACKCFTPVGQRSPDKSSTLQTDRSKACLNPTRVLPPRHTRKVIKAIGRGNPTYVVRLDFLSLLTSPYSPHGTKTPTFLFPRKKSRTS